MIPPLGKFFPSMQEFTWDKYSNPLIGFSVRYPSDIFYPAFNDINPNSPENKAKEPGTDLYMNSAYIQRGFDSGPELNVGFFKLQPKNNYITQKFYGINFIVYYFPQNIKSLRDYFQNNNDFYFSTINGQTVGVLDHTKKLDGEPLSWAKFYFFKHGNDLLKIGTALPESISTPRDKERVFELFEQITKTIKFN